MCIETVQKINIDFITESDPFQSAYFKMAQSVDKQGHGENKFVCVRCGRFYKRKVTLSRHLRLECGQYPQFECPVCFNRFKRNEHLTTHMKSHHTADDLRAYNQNK